MIFQKTLVPFGWICVVFSLLLLLASIFDAEAPVVVIVILFSPLLLIGIYCIWKKEKIIDGAMKRYQKNALRIQSVEQFIINKLDALKRRREAVQEVKLIVAKYCRNCGKDVNAKAEICTNCGVRPLNEKKFCQECGVETNSNQEICIKCGVRLKTFMSNTANGSPANTDFSNLPQYYQDEFRKIFESNETYKGKWNWAAFGFGPIWALTKGVWVAPLIDIVGASATLGVVGVIYWFIFAIRGNYMYYSYIAKNKQLPI